jgi:hypothetical protein
MKQVLVFRNQKLMTKDRRILTTLDLLFFQTSSRKFLIKIIQL